MSSLQKRPSKIYISRSLKYPEGLFDQTVEFLEKQGFIVTYYDKREKYSSRLLLEADVVLVLTEYKNRELVHIPDETPCGKHKAEFWVGKGQYMEVYLATQEGKLVVSNSFHSYNLIPHAIPTMDKVYLKDIQIYLVSGQYTHDTEDWKKTYGKIECHSYGLDGVGIYDFITGYLQIENTIEHQDAVRVTVYGNKLLLITK